VCLQLYDRISSKVVSPTRAPPSDAVQKCREVAEVLREFDQNSPDVECELADLEELREILARPHIRVSTSLCFQVMS
jgi:calcium/calmodulin-dependent serine protein kinase